MLLIGIHNAWDSVAYLEFYSSRTRMMQNHCSLMYREEEREMLPLCKEEKMV